MLKPLCPTCRGLIDPGLEDVLAAPEDPYGLGQVDLRELALMLSHGGGCVAQHCVLFAAAVVFCCCCCC